MPVLKKQPVRDAIRKRLVDAAVAKGVSQKDAEATLKKMESERPLIDWLTSGGIEALIKLFLEFVPLLILKPGK